MPICLFVEVKTPGKCPVIQEKSDGNCQKCKKEKKFKKRLAKYKKVCYYKSRKSGCSAAGSALDWGSRGREFKSRHSDQSLKTLIYNGFSDFLLL